MVRSARKLYQVVDVNVHGRDVEEARNLPDEQSAYHRFGKRLFGVETGFRGR